MRINLQQLNCKVAICRDQISLYFDRQGNPTKTSLSEAKHVGEQKNCSKNLETKLFVEKL